MMRNRNTTRYRRRARSNHLAGSLHFLAKGAFQDRVKPASCNFNSSIDGCAQQHTVDFTWTPRGVMYLLLSSSKPHIAASREADYILLILAALRRYIALYLEKRLTSSLNSPDHIDNYR